MTKSTERNFDNHLSAFQALFIASRGQPIQYDGKTLQLIDYFPLERCKNIRVAFEEKNSEWRQGIAINVEGAFVVNAQKIKKAIVLWQDTAPTTVDIHVLSVDDYVAVYNVWDFGRGSTEGWHNGAAMIVKEISSGRRYYCNDGHPDDNFTDVVFRIERVEN